MVGRRFPPAASAIFAALKAAEQSSGREAPISKSWRYARTSLSVLAIVALAFGLWPLGILLVAVVVATGGGRTGDAGRRLWARVNLAALKDPAVWRVIAWRGVPMILAAVGVAYLAYAAAHTFFPEALAKWEAKRSFELDGVNKLLAVVVAPILEELFFRGALLTAFRRRFAAPTAVVLAGVPFAVGHLDPFGAMTFAIATGLLAVTTNSLAPGMVLHFMNNAVMVGVATLWDESDFGASSVSVETPVFVGVCVALILVGVPAFRAQWRAARRAPLTAPGTP